MYKGRIKIVINIYSTYIYIIHIMQKYIYTMITKETK